MAEMPITIKAYKVYSGTQKPTLIVFHDVEGPCKVGTALAVAKYFASPKAGGSAHYTVDPAVTTHSVPENKWAAHCGTYGNKNSIGIEMAGFAKDAWTSDNHTKTWKRAADLGKEVADRWGIKLQYLSPADLKAGKRNGYTFHRDVTAGLGGTTHTDPGPNFPYAEFKKYIEGKSGTPVVEQPSDDSVLKVGSTGTAVKNLQLGLNRVFPSYSNLVADGIFGAKTESVVKEFQRRTYLTPDGIVGVRTRAVLARHGIVI